MLDSANLGQAGEPRGQGSVGSHRLTPDHRAGGLAVRRCLLIALLGILGLTAIAAPADARKSRKKAIWGPAQVGGVSQFPYYRDLGAGIYQISLNLSQVAPSRPINLANPSDPAYAWPTELDYAIQQAHASGMQVFVLLSGSPAWANGGRGWQWAPKNPQVFAKMAAATSRRYPGVRYWQIWGEPSRRGAFMPLAAAKGRANISRRQERGPRTYAKILDASYAALNRVRRSDQVIGGNTFTTGDISPLPYIKALRLPGGKPPRMDFYGHNPFSNREPNLRKGPLAGGRSDFSDLDRLARHIDRHLSRRGRNGPRLRLFLTEFLIPSDHKSATFNFWVTRQTQARWLAAALRITRRWSRIFGLGWHALYDEPPRPDGLQVNWGLLDYHGNKKPSYFAYRSG
jgi:hypothetical protein